MGKTRAVMLGFAVFEKVQNLAGILKLLAEFLEELLDVWKLKILANAIGGFRMVTFTT